MAEGHSCELHFIDIHHMLTRHIHMPCSERFPATTYARLFLPSLLENETRVVYLDIDLLIFSDLRELYVQDLEGSLAGVVYEEVTEDQKRRKAQLGILPGNMYFNSGVMVMDLAQMRESGVDSQLREYLRKHEGALSLYDQDVLNVVLQGRVKCVHPKWNWPARHTRRQMLFQGSNWGEMGRQKAVEASLAPAILHFWGAPKPTEFNCDFYRRQYRRIWLQSPWRDVPMSGRRDTSYLMKRLRYSLKDIVVRLRLSYLSRKYKSMINKR